jgi:hypothetical protein
MVGSLERMTVFQFTSPPTQFGDANVNRKRDATLLLAGQEDIERSRLRDLSRNGVMPCG